MMQYEAQYTTVHYEIRGTGRPIIMLHGVSLDHQVLVGCMESLFAQHDGWRRIYLDLPGMGQTPAAPELASSDAILELLIEFVDAVVPSERFSLVGHSYGGLLARGLLHRKFELVDGLMLLVPAIVADSTRRILPQQRVIVANPDLIASIDPQVREVFELISVVQTGRVLERTMQDIVPGLMSADMEFIQHLQATAYDFSFDVDALPQPFEGPSLFIAGRQDHIVGYYDALQLHEQYPRATLAVLDSAGHGLQTEQEDLFNALVSNWLQRLAITIAERTQSLA